MAFKKYANNVNSVQILSAFSDISNTFTVTSGEGTLFPATDGRLTVEMVRLSDKVVIKREVVDYSTKSGNIISGVTRAVEECVRDDSQTPRQLHQGALDFTGGTDVVIICSLRYTAGNDEDIKNAIDIETAYRVNEDNKKLNNAVILSKTANFSFTGNELNNTQINTDTSSGNIVHTLNPALFPNTNGCYEFIFVKTSGDANTVIIDAGSGKTIDGSQTYTLSSQWETVTIRILSGTSCKVIATSNKLITIDLPYITKIFTAGEDMTPGKHFRFGVNITIAYSGVGNTSSNTTTSTGTPKYQTISWASSKFNVSSIMHRMSSNSGTHTVSCEIRDATGVTVIATAVATVTVNVTEADYTFTFSSPPTLLPGVTYRIYWIGGNANLNHRAGTNVYADGQSDIGSSNDYYFSMSGNRIIDEDVTKMYIANSSVGGLYTKTKVVGVVKTSVLANNTFTAILSGECDFYSGLTRGEIYKLQDDGSLNTTDGSTVIKSGRAISTTAINFVPPL